MARQSLSPVVMILQAGLPSDQQINVDLWGQGAQQVSLLINAPAGELDQIQQLLNAAVSNNNLINNLNNAGQSRHPLSAL